MRINGTPQNIPFVNKGQVEPVKQQEVAKPKVQDKIEISAEAKILQDQKHTAKINAIKEKVESGFYNSDEVISKVADKVFEEINES